MRVQDIHTIFHGGAIPPFSAIRSTFVDVRDVATCVLRAVEKHAHAPSQPPRERYLLVGNSSPVSPQAAADVLRARYPGRRDVIQEGNPGEAYPDMTWGFDASKAREDLLGGRPWIGFEESVVDSAESFLRLEQEGEA